MCGLNRRTPRMPRIHWSHVPLIVQVHEAVVHYLYAPWRMRSIS
jgi:hypothetical protein